MSFQSTADDIAKHFLSHCGEKPSVRLLTSKGDPAKLAQLSKAKQKSIAKGKASDPSAPTSKGCAFLEFETASALQKALQYHHTQFQGRSINVELTAGGGGKGTDRKEKIKKKNQDLEVERQKIHEKYVKGQKKEKAEGDKAEEPKKEQLPAWGPRASSSSKSNGTTKIPRWAASGSNAVRLSG
jgi:nucleolar protein 6